MIKNFHILIIDDEELILESLGMVLEHYGFDVFTASTGESGLEILRDTPVDLVLLDIRLPGMDGHQVLKHIKFQQPSLPVICLTGFGDALNKNMCMALGATDFLSKPVPIELLLERIQKLL